ncbi:MAG: hypothetical protein KKH28_05255 [Elusimicrobia bacterium]|nr:hypothetical protein [Elusimicrobiota bacterium]
MVKKYALIFFVLLAAGLSPARAAESKPAYNWASASGPVSGADGGLREIIVVSKTHFDIGFTGLPSEIIAWYRTEMIDRALETVEQSRGLAPEQRFTWTLPGWPLAQVLWPGQTPGRRERVMAALRDGSLAAHALPFTMHTESLELEEIVRGLRYAQVVSRSAGQSLPSAAKMTDVPEHAWILPTLLKRAGIGFLHLGSNEASAVPEVPLLFWWEGPDGSRLLTMYAGSYGSGIHPPKDWPHKTWLYMWMTNDNHGPPRPDEVGKLFETAAKELPGVNPVREQPLTGTDGGIIPPSERNTPYRRQESAAFSNGVKVRFGRLEDFAGAILAEKPELPVVRGDMPDTWIHGLLAMPVETALARNIRPQIGTLEKLDTLSGIWGIKTDSAADAVDAAYEDSLLYGEHTWGRDVKAYGYRYGDEWKKAVAAGHYDSLLQAFEEHRAYIRRADRTITPAIARLAGRLADSVDAPGRRLVVFNPLPWRRDAVVPASWDGADRFLARDLPPLGYRTFLPGEQKPAGILRHDRAEVIENDFFRVTLDPERCGIKSIVEQATGRELVKPGAKMAFGQYFYERFDTDRVELFQKEYLRNRPQWAFSDFGKPNLPPAKTHPYQSAGAAHAGMTVVVGAVSATATLQAPAEGIIPDSTTLRVTLYRGQPYVDLEWEISGKTPDSWPEGGWLYLPLNVDRPQFRLSRLGSVIDPAKDIVPGSNHDVFCLDGGMTVTGADGGVGLIPLDSPLVSIGRPGLWRHSPEFNPENADVYVMLHNNQWGTNFPQWTGGSWRSRVRLWSVRRGSTETESLLAPSWEARAPAVAAVSQAAGGRLPPEQGGLRLSRPGVLVTAFGRNPSGDGLLLRLWEQAGSAAPVRVELPGGMNVGSAQPCDLRGTAAGAAIAVINGSFTAPLEPYAPQSLLLK